MYLLILLMYLFIFSDIARANYLGTFWSLTFAVKSGFVNSQQMTTTTKKTRSPYFLTLESVQDRMSRKPCRWREISHESYKRKQYFIFSQNEKYVPHKK